MKKILTISCQAVFSYLLTVWQLSLTDRVGLDVTSFTGLVIPSLFMATKKDKRDHNISAFQTLAEVSTEIPSSKFLCLSYLLLYSHKSTAMLMLGCGLHFMGLVPNIGDVDML